ncbi:MAG: LysM domain-containing protein [Leptothrix sp. (in: b-proteobacteria)]
MSDPLQALQALLQPASLQQTLYPPSSRYSGVPIASLQSADGRTLPYLRRRFLPAPESLSLVQVHVVSQGDRLDNLAALYLGDAEQFWRLCDANCAMRPDALTEVTGRLLRITMPAGFPGAGGA